MRVLVLALLTVAAAAAQAPPPASGVRTMRVDYFHTGDATQEIFSFDEAVVEPAVWSGHAGREVDPINYGAYGFDVRDAASKTLLYSRGFGSIFDEWSTTDEATKMTRTFHESVRFPMPKAPVAVTIRKRVGSGTQWRELWTTTVDPRNMFVNPVRPEPSPGALIEFEKHGDPADKVDLLLLGDGYTAAERKKFEADSQRLLAVLFATSPFKERRNDFNVWALTVPVPESGVSRPSTGLHHASATGARYDIFGSERYILTLDNRAFRDLAQYAPYEFVEIVINGQTYGGGGIFGQFSTVAADNDWADYVFVHEFGHHFAGLADEYYTSPVAYAAGEHPTVEPWEPNVTALLQPDRLKWKDQMSPVAERAAVPLPTPWPKAEYEAYERDIQARRVKLRADKRPESEMSALFREEQAHVEALFADARYRDAVGAFEGANYAATGYYRPQMQCMMFTRADAFCSVCRHAISDIIDLYTAAR